MPVYQYVVLNDKQPQEVIEIEQSVDAPHLTEHPITKESIRKVLTAPSLSLNHSSTKEKKILSKDNLNKKGFSVYHKDQTDGTYHKATGSGPESIRPEPSQ
jgi:hypothetical protein